MKYKPYRDSSMIQIRIGDIIKIRGSEEIGEVFDIKLVPNGTYGTNATGLVALVCVKTKTRTASMSSDKFEPIPDEGYKEFYPSDIFRGKTEKGVGFKWANE